MAALNRLLEVTRRLAAEMDLTKILAVIGSEACQALACERASFYQYNAQTGDLFTLLATDLEIAEIRHPLDQGISGYAARERVLVNVADPAADPRWNAPASIAKLATTRAASSRRRWCLRMTTPCWVCWSY